MDILLMKIADYEEVYKLWKNTEGMGLRSLDDSRDGIMTFLNRNPNTNFVCKENNKVVGVILSGHDGRRGYIYHLAVSQKYRKKGIGKILVEKVICALKTEGIKKIALVVFDANESGNAFWESVGFIKREDLVYRNFTIDLSNK